MKYIHLLPALLAAFITFAHPLIDPEHESPVEVREAAAAPNSPPSM